MSKIGNTSDNARKNKRTIMGQPIIEIEANKEIMNTHIYIKNIKVLDN